MDEWDKIQKCNGFQWDQGNIQKNWIKHKVSPYECEQIFFHQPLIIAQTNKHAQKEVRYFALGQTDQKRQLFVVFTIRRNLLRIISARDMDKKERLEYRKHEK